MMFLSLFASSLFADDAFGLKVNLLTTNRMTLSWNDISYMEQGYYVEYQVNQSNFRVFSFVPSNTTSCLFPYIAANIQYGFRVSALMPDTSRTFSEKLYIKILKPLVATNYVTQTNIVDNYRTNFVNVTNIVDTLPNDNVEFSFTPTNAVIRWYDTNGYHNGNLDYFKSNAIMDTVLELRMQNCGIRSLTLGKKLPNLHAIIAAGNYLTELDLSGCPSLIFLYVNDNNLTNINLRNLPQLKALDIAANFLTEIDLSQNPLLYFANIYNMPIQTIDLSNNPLIQYIDFGGNPLTTASFNAILVELDAFGIKNGTALLYATTVPNESGRTAANNLAKKGWTLQINNF